MPEIDILAVPATEYMGEAHLKYFRELLGAKLQEVQHSAEAEKKRLAELGVAADALDQALIEEERQAIGRTLERLRVQAGEIARSITAIGDGEYGWCELSGEEIGLMRLLAQPTARYSTTVQANMESKARHFHAGV